jgi:mannose-1-phosphate guanylyltransferase
VVVEMLVDWIPSARAGGDGMDGDNAVAADTAVFLDSDGNIIISTQGEHLISTIGLSDMIIVHTPDATMVLPKSEAQRVKELVGKVKEKFGNRFL